MQPVIKRYWGVVILLFSLVMSFFLDKKINGFKSITKDATEQGIENISQLISVLNFYKKQDSSFTMSYDKLDRLYREARKTNAYDEKMHMKIKDAFPSLKKEKHGFLSNHALLNIICAELLEKKVNEIDYKELYDQFFYLLVEEIQDLGKDSVELTIIPFEKNFNTESIIYYYKEDRLTAEELQHYTGELKYLRAKVTNPVTMEQQEYRGR